MSSEQSRRMRDAVIARMEELGLTQQDVAASGGPSTSTLTLIAKGEWDPGRLAATSLRKLDAGLQWTPGTARRIWHGDPPAAQPTTAPTVRPPSQTGDYAEAPGERRQVTLTEEQLEAIVRRAVQDALGAALPMDPSSPSQ